VPAEIDAVLELLADKSPEFGGGLSNHGPMAAEALFALGQGDLAMDWALQYSTRLEPFPALHRRITRDDWQQALGDFTRVADWVAFFANMLIQRCWQDVVGEWASQLVSGLFAGATHGLIRTGHAVRSLEMRETPPRIHELAQGLGYWASRYQRLPGKPSGSGTLLPSEAIRSVEMLPSDLRLARGLITTHVRQLAEFPEFDDVINAVDTTGDPASFVFNLTETSARMLLYNVPRVGSVIAFIHALTGPRMLRVLTPYLKAADVPAALAYGWQAAAAIQATYGEPLIDEPIMSSGGAREDLIACAVATADEHAIKFTEACLSENGLHPNTAYLAAAWDVVQRLA